MRSSSDRFVPPTWAPARRPQRQAHRPATSAFTLIEIIVVMVILVAVASVGMGVLTGSLDVSRARAGSDRLYYLLQRQQFEARTRNDSTVSYGVCILRGTIMQGNSVVDAGFSLIPWQVSDPFHPIAMPLDTLQPANTLQTQEKTELIPLDPSIRFTKQWLAGNTYPPAQPAGSTYIAFGNTGSIDTGKTTVTSLNAYNPVDPPNSTFKDGMVYEFDVVADWGYQRYRLSAAGLVDRSIWNDLSVATPQSVSYGNF